MFDVSLYAEDSSLKQMPWPKLNCIFSNLKVISSGSLHLHLYITVKDKYLVMGVLVLPF